jgi:hypothetical protein
MLLLFCFEYRLLKQRAQQAIGGASQIIAARQEIYFFQGWISWALHIIPLTAELSNRPFGESFAVSTTKENAPLAYVVGHFLWWRLPDSNWGHKALQASALPTELKRHQSTLADPVILPVFNIFFNRCPDLVGALLHRSFAFHERQF